MTKEEKRLGRWLSNVSTQDAEKIKKVFSQVVVEGPPRRTDRESVEELTKDGIIGLYAPKE